MISRFNLKRGFSFSEVLVYVGILSLMTATVISGLVYITSTYKDFKLSKDLYDSVMVSLDRFGSEIRAATSIDLGGSVFGSNPGRLSLNLDPAGGGPDQVAFFVEDGTLYISQDGVFSGALTASSTSVTSLNLARIITPVSEGVKVSITLSVGSGSELHQESFSTTAVMRGSYLNR